MSCFSAAAASPRDGAAADETAITEQVTRAAIKRDFMSSSG
jgi:hypothetical protein